MFSPLSHVYRHRKKVLNLVLTVAPEYNHLWVEIAPGPSLAIKIQMLRSVVKDGVIYTCNLHVGHNRLLIIPNAIGNININVNTVIVLYL